MTIAAPKRFTIEAARLRERLARGRSTNRLSDEEYSALQTRRAAESMPCQPRCPHCGGIGYTRVDVPRDHPDFGRIKPCPNKLKRDLLSGADSRLGLQPDEIDGYHWGLVRPGISDGDKGRNAARRAYELGHGLVMLYGTFGQAKTLTLKIAVAQALRDGKSAAYANMSAIIDDLLMAYDEESHRQTELLRRMDFWKSLPILAIDELDKVNATPWARQRIHQLLDHRYMLAIRMQALTVLAANTSPERGLDDLDGYLVSRLRDSRFADAGMLVELNGPDGRAAMPQGYKF